MGQSLAVARPARAVTPELAGDAVWTAGVVALGAAFACVSARAPASPLAALVWGFSWPGYLAAGFALSWYARGILRTPAASRPSLGRIICFVLGVGLLYAVLQTRFLYFSEHMFFLHRVQHLVMHHTGPFLIALAWPGESVSRGMPSWLVSVPQKRGFPARPLRAVLGAIQRPVPAAILFAGLVFLWVWPPLHLRAMVDIHLFGIMNWSMVLDGLLFFFLLMDPRPVTPRGHSFAVRIVLALSVQIPQIALGGTMLFADRDLYPWYDLCGRVYPAISALADQQMGALVILFGGGMMSAIAALVLLGRLLRAEAASVALPAGGL